jgi:hypothetical protein
MSKAPELPPRMWVKPAEGRLIRHPRTFRPMRAEGMDVTSEAGYFHRLLRVGDVVRRPPRSTTDKASED